MPERRTRSAGPVQIKAPIAGKAQSNRSAHGASFSKAIAKIGNAAMRRSELDGPALRYLNKQMLIHELIRGSLSTLAMTYCRGSFQLCNIDIQHS
jgi:hypothetical protein